LPRVALTAMNRNKKILRGLSSEEYEHPFDRKALDTLEATPGLGVLGKFLTKHTVERIYTIQYTGSYLKVTNKNYPNIYEYLEYAAQILGLPTVPQLYIQWGYDINAFTVGSENPIIVLNSGLLDLCDEDELMFIIGHECGHIKSNHMLYHMMAQMVNFAIDAIPGGSVVAAPVKYALLYWDRMSEFTADRAGLLCCQKPTSVIKAFIKMAGLPKSEYSKMDINTFLEQAQEFKDLDYEGLNKIVKILSIAEANHPWTVMRAAQLVDWISAGEAKRIINIH